MANSLHILFPVKNKKILLRTREKTLKTYLCNIKSEFGNTTKIFTISYYNDHYILLYYWT